MKMFPALLVFAALVGNVGCKLNSDSTVSGIEGEKPKQGSCSNVQDWLASPVTCQKDKMQVVVKRVIPHLSTGYKYMGRISLNWVESVKQVGIHTCFGEIEHYSGGQWRSGAGVWLNGQSGLGGCHAGVGYRNISSGAKGANVVTPVVEELFSIDGKRGYALSLPGMKSKFIGSSETLRIDEVYTQYFDLCTGVYEKVCDIRVSDGTLKIELR